jgi:hypothetical protein
LRSGRAEMLLAGHRRAQRGLQTASKFEFSSLHQAVEFELSCLFYDATLDALCLLHHPTQLPPVVILTGLHWLIPSKREKK